MQEPIDVLIVDDEPAGRNILELYLENYCSGVSIVGKASSAVEALRLVEESQPDLIFLDIEMPGQSGISFLEGFDHIPFEVVFTTAYEKYAIKAFELSALHYLLKPFKVEELQLALEKYRRQRNLKHSQKKIEVFLEHYQQQKSEGRMAIHTSEAIEILEIQRIVRAQAEGNYSNFFMDNGKTWLASRTLKEFVPKLEPHGFVRIHRSHLVNMAFIRKLWKAKSHQIELKDGTILSLSNRRREEFMKRFSDQFGLDEF